MERVFYKAHDNVTKIALRNSTPHQRTLIENATLFLAVISFSAVILCHRTFVYRGGAIKSQAISARGWNIPSMCLKSVSGFRNDADVTHIVIYDVDDLNHSRYDVDGKKDNDDGFGNIHLSDGGMSCTNDHSNNNSYSYSSRGDDFESKSFITFIEPLSNSNDAIPQRNTCNTNTNNEERERILKSITPKNITYSFSLNKGFLFLPPNTLSSRNISSQYVIIYSNNKRCFSDDPLLNRFGQRFSGLRDTIVLNWILGFRNGTNGFIHTRNGSIIDLEEYLNEYLFRWPTKMTSPHLLEKNNGATTTTTTSTSNPIHMAFGNGKGNGNGNDNDGYPQAPTTISYWYHHYLIFKAGVLISSLFLFFVTTTLVSFTLRETQDRMLQFTYQLQLQIRRRQPYGGLIFTHVIGIMVFIPIMIGMIFFLTDCCYNGDKFLAFVILSGVWICEVFSAISMRTIQSSVYYPQVFFAYFTLFHVYYFSCPFGFSYAALASTILFQLHSMLFFWNRYELPAILCGQISHENPRMTLYNTNMQNVSATPAVVETTIHHENENGNNVSRTSMTSLVSTGQELQRLRSSYPSMSSLGRMASVEGYWVLMDGDGEVAMRQNPGSTSSSIR